MGVPMPLRWKTWIIVVLLPWLAACSTVRLSYDQGPTLAYWWLDAQLDLDGDQRAPVQDALARWFEWHRATQLPELADWLDGLQRLAADKVTPAQVCATWQGLQQRMLRWYAHLVPAMVGPARALKPAQIDHLAMKYAKDYAQLREDYLQPDPAERRAAQRKRTIERFEDIYGRLPAAAPRPHPPALEVTPFDPARGLAERRQRQLDVVAGLRRIATEQPDDATVAAILVGFGEQAAASPRPDYRALQQQVMQTNCEVIASVHNALDDAQRQRAVKRLAGWQSDARALAPRRD
jgi:hypothetical protein